ncbi:MAG: hypothetical protein ACJ701_03900 [Nitrososphaera sp.]
MILDARDDSESNYRKIQEIVNQYQFNDSAVRRIALKMLAATKRQIARYDQELKNLDNKSSSTAGNKKGKGKGKEHKRRPDEIRNPPH